MDGDIIHIGDSVQYFDFNKQILVQTKKEMHIAYSCELSVLSIDKQFCA